MAFFSGLQFVAAFFLLSCLSAGSDEMSGDQFIHLLKPTGLNGALLLNISKQQ